MNYEEAYKEALERAKMILCNIPEGSASVRDIETIFPELRESEDERIRNGLVKLLTVASEAYLLESTGIKKDSYLAYLEKQKERGPLTKEEEYILNRIIEYLEDNNCPFEWNNLLCDIYNLPYTKQKEQKPVWSEEDKKMIDDIIRALPKMAEAEDNILPEILPSVARKYVERLKSLRPSWKPSEEQIYSLGTVVKGYNECTVGSVGYNLKELYEQLKAL